LKEKIDAICISPYDWSKNLICIAHKSKIISGAIKFQVSMQINRLFSRDKGNSKSLIF